MAIPIISKLKPANNGSFSLMDSSDIEMPDGNRLDDWFAYRPEIQVVPELPEDAADHPDVIYLVLEGAIV